ncbi:MAG: tetratricopeptide repeat protein, partial [Myxococcaceae bacterium]
AFGFSAADARMISSLAFDLLDAGQIDGAEKIFAGLLALNPKDASIRAALGAVFHKLGRIEDAEAEYEAALAIEPKAVLARVNRGELRLRRGDTEGVEDLKLAAGEDSPVHERAQHLLQCFSG